MIWVEKHERTLTGAAGAGRAGGTPGNVSASRLAPNGQHAATPNGQHAATPNRRRIEYAALQRRVRTVTAACARHDRAAGHAAPHGPAISRDLHRGAGQAVREDHRAGRPRPRRPARHRAGGARAERRGQDHARSHPGHAAASRRRPRPGGRVRRRRAAGQGPEADHAHRAVCRRRRGPHRAGEPAADREAAGVQPQGGPKARRRAARAVRPGRGRRAAGQDLFRRHAQAAGPGDGPGRRAAGAVS